MIPLNANINTESDIMMVPLSTSYKPCGGGIGSCSSMIVILLTLLG
jgi:hypothetical protein